jgi:nucleotidyltransferase/DNA polymerase involved in DNA repair
LTDYDALALELQPLIEKVWRHCEATGARGRTATLKVKFSDFELITRSRSVALIDTASDLSGCESARQNNPTQISDVKELSLPIGVGPHADSHKRTL